MMRGFFNGDFLNPLDFPGWQPIGAMDVEDMFEMGNLEFSDPVEMLPMMPRQFEIQDPAQEAFQFPFQYPMQDPSGGEGGQYAPADVPENMLQEMGATSLPIDETAKETGESMTEQQGGLGDIQLPELMNNVERMMQAQEANPSISMVGENFEGGQMGAPYPTDEELARMAEQARPPLTHFNDLRTQDDFNAMTNEIEGALIGDMSPTDDMIRELAQQNAQEILSPIEQAQAMFNPQQELPSEENIPQSVEQMYGVTADEQIERHRMYDPATYAIQVPELSDQDREDYDAMYDPESYGERKPFQPNLHQSLLQNVWEFAEQQSLTEDWGLIGGILQNINPSESLVANVLNLITTNDSVSNNSEALSKSGSDNQATDIVNGKIVEAMGLDIQTVLAEGLKDLLATVAKLL